MPAIIIPEDLQDLFRRIFCNVARKPEDDIRRASSAAGFKPARMSERTDVILRLLILPPAKCVRQ